MENLFEMPRNTQSFWASAENPICVKGGGGTSNRGRKGKAYIKLKSDETYILAQAQNQGMIRRIWITMTDRSPKMMRGVKLRFYWDNIVTPAVDVPIGDFFCNPLGEMMKLDNEWFSNPEGRSFNCFIPMPFRTGMNITVTNETDEDIQELYYTIEYTLGDEISDKTMYFHAFYNRQQQTVPMCDYEILPKVNGKGRFLGCSIGVQANTAIFGKTWWGEGEVKVYLDGDNEFPTLCGTGTEDYIGSAWELGEFSTRYQGCTLCDKEKFRFGFYRMHAPDPVYFYKDIKVTIQQIGSANPFDLLPHLIQNKIETIGIPGFGLSEISVSQLCENIQNKDNLTGCFERYDDWSSVAYFYLDKPCQ